MLVPVSLLLLIVVVVVSVVVGGAGIGVVAVAVAIVRAVCKHFSSPMLICQVLEIRSRGFAPTQ